MCRRSTVHLLLLTSTAAASISVLPFLYLSAHLYVSLSHPERVPATAKKGVAVGEERGAQDAVHHGGSPGSSRKSRWLAQTSSKLRQMYQAYRCTKEGPPAPVPALVHAAQTL